MSGPTGRGNPPEASRFTKGRSGNPKGRPKRAGTPAASAFDILIDKVLTVSHGGEPREVTVEEALQHRTYQEAIAGNRSARRTILLHECDLLLAQAECALIGPDLASVRERHGERRAALSHQPA